MRHNKTLTLLALGLVACAARAEKKRYDCRENLAVEGEPFRRSVFLVELANTTFYDSNGEPFWFDPPSPRGRLSMSLTHSTLGHVDDEGHLRRQGAGVFAGFVMAPNGSIDGSDAHVSYGRHQNRGFLTALFTFFRDKLPNGVEFTILDISVSQELGQRASQISAGELERFAASGEGLLLYAMYRKIRASVRPNEQLADAWDPRAEAGFRNYLADVGSVWGRVCRHGNFRRDYWSPRAFPCFAYFRKVPIPDAVRREEDALLASLPVAHIIDELLPPSRMEMLRQHMRRTRRN